MSMQRFVDGWMCFPDLVILIVAVSVIGPGMWQIILVLALQFGIAGSRIIRGATLSTKENMYVRAADSMGASTLRMLLRHILPNIMAPIIILFTTRIAAIILPRPA
jgi:peptide/nickel transport system permease protein